IAVPGSGSLQSIAWSAEGWIACGGLNGFVKVMKTDSGASTSTNANKSGACYNLKLAETQKLEGHNGKITKIEWNDAFNKLITIDEHGLITVWMMNSGKWIEEMVIIWGQLTKKKKKKNKYINNNSTCAYMQINKREESEVASMRWNRTGEKIAVAYQDGTVIVGLQDGNREWVKNVQMPLKTIEWSPDGAHLIMVTTSNQVKLFDKSGKYVSDLQISCSDDQDLSSRNAHITDIRWCSHVHNEDTNASKLVVVYDNGHMQLLRTYNDPRPILLDTDMWITCIRWNSNGSILAVVGKKSSKTAESSRSNSTSKHGYLNFIQFFSSFGQVFVSLSSYFFFKKKNEESVTDATWSADGQILALTIDEHIYFALCKINTRYCTFQSQVLCYCIEHINSTESSAVESSREPLSPYVDRSVLKSLTNDPLRLQCICFWDTIADMFEVKWVQTLHAMGSTAVAPYVLIAHSNNILAQSSLQNDKIECELALCNSIGQPLSREKVPFAPTFCTVTKYFGIAASQTLVFIWQHTHDEKLLAAADGILSTVGLVSKLFHVDELCETKTQENTTKTYGIEDKSSDPVCAITGHDKCIILARQSGDVVIYSILQEIILHRVHMNATMTHISVNCNMTHLAAIDVNKSLTLLDLAKSNQIGNDSNTNHNSVSTGPKGQTNSIYLQKATLSWKRVMFGMCFGWLSFFEALCHIYLPQTDAKGLYNIIFEIGLKTVQSFVRLYKSQS
ncbi:hypothetical protein RFI_08637, partial [Reticulomyxa filosa]